MQMKMKLNWGLSCDYADGDGAAFTNIFDSANSLLELKIFTGHFGVSGSRITSRTPPGDGRGDEGENYKFQHTGTCDPCTDMSDLIAPPGAFPHYVFWLGPFFSSGSPRSALGSMRNYKHERAPKTSTDNT